MYMATVISSKEMHMATDNGRTATSSSVKHQNSGRKGPGKKSTQDQDAVFGLVYKHGGDQRQIQLGGGGNQLSSTKSRAAIYSPSKTRATHTQRDHACEHRLPP